MALSDISIADLEAALREKRDAQAAADLETPHTALLADLRDGRLKPRELAELFERMLAGFDLLGVDLLAEGGPAKVKRAATPPKDAPAETAGAKSNGGAE